MRARQTHQVGSVPRYLGVIVTERAQSDQEPVTHPFHHVDVPPGGMPSPWRPTGRCSWCPVMTAGATGAGAPGWSSAQHPPSSPAEAGHAVRVTVLFSLAGLLLATAAVLTYSHRRALTPARRRRPPAGVLQRQPRPGPPPRGLTPPTRSCGRSGPTAAARGYHFNSDDRWFYTPNAAQLHPPPPVARR